MRGHRFLTALIAALLVAGCGDDMPARPPTDSPPTTSQPPPPSMSPTRSALCASGQICTVAGTATPGDGDDALPARETRLYLPMDTTVGPDRRLYVVDW